MLLNVFRKNQFLRSVLLLPLCMLLYADLFLMEAPMTPLFNEMVDSRLHAFQQNYPVLHWLSFSFLIFVSSILLNRLVIIHRLSSRPTLYAGLFLVVLASIWPPLSGLSSISIGLPVLLMLVANLLHIQAASRAMTRLFNVGLYLGVLLLLSATYIWVLVPVMIGISILARLNWRQVLNVVNGMLLAPFFAWVYQVVVTGRGPVEVVASWTGQFSWPSGLPIMTQQGWSLLIGIILSVLFVFLSYGAAMSRKGIHVIRKISTITWFMVAVLFIYLSLGMITLHPAILMMPIVAYFVAEGVLRFRRSSSAELVFILLLILSGVMPFISMG